MKLIISRRDFLNSLQKLNRIIPSRSTLPILNCILFEVKNNKLILRATDLEQTIKIHLNIKSDYEGKLALPIKTLLEITQAVDEEILTLNIKESYKIDVVTSLGVYSIMGKNPLEFPEDPKPENPTVLEISKNELKDILSDTLYATSKDEMKISLQGIFFKIKNKQITAVATDGFRLVKRVTILKKEVDYEGEVIIPSKFLTVLQSYLTNEKITFMLSLNHVEVVNENTTFLSRIIKERYPDYESIIPENNNKTVLINREDLLSAVKRVSIFSNRTTKQISLTFDDNSTTIKTEDPEKVNSAKEIVNCDYKSDPLVIGFNSNYLKEILNNFENNEIYINLDTPLTAGMILPNKNKKNTELISLLMPIRI